MSWVAQWRRGRRRTEGEKRAKRGEAVFLFFHQDRDTFFLSITSHLLEKTT